MLHAHLTALLQLLDRLADSTRPRHPAAGRHLATAHTRLWQATSEVHAAFHLLLAAREHAWAYGRSLRAVLRRGDLVRG